MEDLPKDRQPEVYAQICPNCNGRGTVGYAAKPCPTCAKTDHVGIVYVPARMDGGGYDK